MKRAILNFFGRNPVTGSIIIFFVYLVLATLAGLAAKAFFPQFQPEFVALCVMSLILVAVLSYLNWWREAGFNSPSEWRSLQLLWFPAIVVMVLPFLKGMKPLEPGSFLYLLVAYALTGFMEEGLMRGIVMRVLQPTGIVRSVVISALLFALLHLGNLLYRNPAIVLAQMLGAFVHGVGLGAIRLRTNTLWFVIALHGLHDLALRYSNFPTIPLDVVQVTLLMLYGIYLLRSWKTPRTTPSVAS